MVHICSHDGCGFTAVEMPRFPWGCLLVSVYLKDSVGTRRQPNGEILQEICAIVKPYRNFIIMGDWNSSPQEIANCGLLQGTGGGLIHAGEATVDSGGCLDFAVVSRSLSGLSTCNLDWQCPFKPHAGFFLTVDVTQACIPVPQLRGFGQPTSQHGQDEGQGMLGDVPIPRKGITEVFIHFTRQVELAQFGKVQGRGFYNPIVLTPLAKQTSSVKWFGLATATWDRILKLLSLVPAHPLPKALWEAGGKHWQGSAEALEDWRSCLLAPPGDPAQEEARKVAHLQWSQARAQEIEQSSASYKSWLQESSQGGMKPIFKAIKAHEAKVDRPFTDKPVTARPFLPQTEAMVSCLAGQGLRGRTHPRFEG